MIQMNKKSVFRLLGIGAGKWAEGLDQGDTPPDSRQHTLHRPKDIITAGAARKGGKWLAGMAIMAALLGPGNLVAKQVTVTKSPGTVGTGVGNAGQETAWTSTSATGTSTVTIANTYSNYLNYSNFTFGIPTYAKVKGLTFVIQKSKTATGTATDYRVRLRTTERPNGFTTSGPSAVFVNQSTDVWTTGTVTDTIGGSTNLWGETTLTPAQLNNTDFGINYMIQKSGANPTVSLISPSATVTYTVPGITLASSDITVDSTTYGVESNYYDVAVAGTDMDGNVTATLNSDKFEISNNGGSSWVSTSAGTLTFNVSSGAVSGTLRIRVKAGVAAVAANEVTNAVTFTSLNADTVNLDVHYVVGKKPVAVTAANDSKCYDATILGGEVLPGARYTVTGLLSPDAYANVELSSTGFASMSTAGTHSIIPANLELTTGLLSNYNITYNNGTLTITDQVKGRISGAANDRICNGSNASINIENLGGGTPSIATPFAGVFAIVKDGTTDTVSHPFSITGAPFAVSVPASLLPATSGTTKYFISWKSLDNMNGCSTSSAASLTGFVSIDVYQTPTINVTGTPASGSVCSGVTPSFNITNPNALSGAVYDMTANYHNITGGSHAAGHLGSAFGTLTEGTLVNSGNTTDSVTYTFTARREGTLLCSSTPVVVKYYVQPVVKFDSLTISDSAVCHENLEGTEFTIKGLLPSTDHELTFNITGDDENLGQVATRTSDTSGNIVFSANDFNGGDPNPGTYTFTLTSVKANDCTKAITTLNAKTLTINPTPTFTDVTLEGESTICQDSLTNTTIHINGLLANTEHTLTFDITGDDENTGQTADLTSDASGVISFSAADFNGGAPAPGSYTFALTGLEVKATGCVLAIEDNNSQAITINPKPTFDSLSATAASVCANNLEAETMTIHGLLPETEHTISFTVTGEEESGATQTATLSSDEVGNITFDGTLFNGGSPDAGTYTLKVTNLEVAGCALAVTANNTKTIEIKPTPTVTGVSFSSESVCISEIDSTFAINFTGLLPESDDSLYAFMTFSRDGAPDTAGFFGGLLPLTADASGNAALPIGASGLEYLANQFLTTYKLTLSVIGVSSNGCITMLDDTLKASTIIYNTPKVESLDVDMESVCADDRGDATFTINGVFAAEVDYTFNYTITKGGTVISTDDYTFNLETPSEEITFPASIFAGASVVPGNYTLTLNSATMNGCTVTFEGETQPSADLELTSDHVVTKANDTIYVGNTCTTNVPNYVGSENFTLVSSCISNVVVEQIAPNAPGASVIGYGGDRTVRFKITSTIANGGVAVTYDSIKVHIADTTRPNAIAHSTHTVYLNNAGTASLSAAAINNGSFDNCPSSTVPLDIKVSRGMDASGSSVYFTCADNSPVTVTLYVKDVAGNMATTTATVTVVDTVRPVISGAMANLTVNRGELCTNTLPDYTLTLDGISYSDNCSTGSFTFEQSPEPGTIIAKSIDSQLVTIKVIDDSHNEATTSFVITYVDKTAPVFAGVPTEDVTVSAESGACAANVELPYITATDNCTEEVMVTIERGDGMEGGSEFQLGTTTITYIATDEFGNADTGSYNVVVTPTITAPEIVLESVDFYNPFDAPVDMGYLIKLTTTTESPCAATVNNWPTAVLTGTPCDSLDVTLTESWTIDGDTVTSDYEFPLGYTSVEYKATYTYGDTEVSGYAEFTVEVEDETAPVIADIEDKAFVVNAEDCKASIAPTGMDVVISNTCVEEETYISWIISGADMSGEGQISDHEGNILLSAGNYTVTYTVTDGSDNDATTSFDIVVTNPLDAMIEGTATVVKNALTTSTVKFTGEDGLAPYTFIYDVLHDGDTASVNNIVSSLEGSSVVTIAQPNSTVGTFTYILKSVQDARGCVVLADTAHIFQHTATITVIEPTSADISMNVRIAPASLKSTGVPREVNFRLTNIGGTATTSGVVSFVVTKPRANVSGTPTCTLTATTSGWEVIPHSNPNYWTVRSTSAISINGGSTLQEVKCNLTYTGPAKGSATVTATMPNGVGGDSNNSNNSFSRTIIIN